MTPAPIPARPAESLEQLAALETSSRIRYRGRPATVLEIRREQIAYFARAAVVLEVLFDDRPEPERLVAATDNLDAFELLPRPRVYAEEVPA